MRIALVLALAAVATQTAEARCITTTLEPRVLSNGFGVVVGELSADGAATQPWPPRWTMQVQGKDVTPVIETFAPGLVAYHLPPNDVSSRGVLLAGKKQLVVKQLVKLPVLGAPELKQLVHFTTRTKNPIARQRSTTRVIVRIEGAVPAAAVAIVITDADGKALSFGRVQAGESLVAYWQGGCSTLPDGTEEPALGSMARVFWVDKYGRASQKSEPMKITKQP